MILSGFFMYSIINIDLNMPCYFASIEEMTNDYLKKICLFHICMLKPNENHTCSMMN
jgi:hypothetical protein